MLQGRSLPGLLFESGRKPFAAFPATAGPQRQSAVLGVGESALEQQQGHPVAE